MADVIYNGDISPCRIRVHGVLFNKWEKGEVREVSEEVANELMKNADFDMVKEKKKSTKKDKEEEVIEEVEEVLEESFDSDD